MIKALVVFFYIEYIYMASFRQLLTSRQTDNTEDIEENTANIESLLITRSENIEALSSLQTQIDTNEDEILQ